MTSKISFSKFLKADIRHRAWLAALSWIIFLLGETVYAMLSLESSLQDVSPQYMENQLRMVRNIFPGMLNGSYGFILAGILFVFAILCAVTGFSFLHSKDKTDFYHSLPLSRTQLFLISYTGGLLIFLVPYLACSLLTILVGASYGIITASVLGRSCLAVLGGILGFLLIYHVTVLAMLLTGKLVTGVLAALALSVYGSMTCAVIFDLAPYFLETYSSQGQTLYNKLYGFASPFVMFNQLIGSMATIPEGYRLGYSYYIYRFYLLAEQNGTIALLTVTVILLAVLWILSLSLYKHRSSEAAGNALAYPKTASWIKVLISIPTAISIGILAGSGSYSGGTKWIIIISILAVILLCGLIEFIYHMDLRSIFAGKYSSLLSIFSVTAILCILQFDLFGFDTWLPKEDELESMSFEIDQTYGYFSYPYTTALNVNRPQTTDLLNGEEGQVQDFAPLYDLAGKCVENAENGITPKSVYTENIPDEYVTLTMRYNKKSGKPVYRNYAVGKEQALDTLTALCRDEGYRRTLFPVFYIDSGAVNAVRLMDIYMESVLLNLSPKQQTALFDAYKKDVLQVDIADLQYEAPIVELEADMPDPETESAGYDAKYYNNTVTIYNLYIYESYENTLALLEDYGYTIRRSIDPEDVEQMKLIAAVEADIAVDVTSSAMVDSEESVVTDPDEIKKYLSQIRYPANGILGQNLITSRSVEIILKGDPEPHYFSLP